MARRRSFNIRLFEVGSLVLCRLARRLLGVDCIDDVSEREGDDGAVDADAYCCSICAYTLYDIRRRLLCYCFHRERKQQT